MLQWLRRILLFSLKSQPLFSRDTRECFLFIGSLLVCLLAASATNNRMAPSKPCVCCEREMLLEKLASSPPELRARRNIMHCFLLAEKLDTMCPLSECAMATIRYVWGSPGGPARFPLLRHQALRSNGFWYSFLGGDDSWMCSDRQLRRYGALYSSLGFTEVWKNWKQALPPMSSPGA